MSRVVALIAGSLVVAAVLACSGEGDSMPRGCGQLPLYDLTEFPDQPTDSQKAAIATAAGNFCITGVGTASTETPSRSGGSGGSAGSTGSGGTPADAGAADGDAAP
jgi:hypothetical protein